jgi:hypothetical protein
VRGFSSLTRWSRLAILSRDGSTVLLLARQDVGLQLTPETVKEPLGPEPSSYVKLTFQAVHGLSLKDFQKMSVVKRFGQFDRNRSFQSRIMIQSELGRGVFSGWLIY